MVIPHLTCCIFHFCIHITLQLSFDDLGEPHLTSLGLLQLLLPICYLPGVSMDPSRTWRWWKHSIQYSQRHSEDKNISMFIIFIGNRFECSCKFQIKLSGSVRNKSQAIIWTLLLPLILVTWSNVVDSCSLRYTARSGHPSWCHNRKKKLDTFGSHRKSYINMTLFLISSRLPNGLATLSARTSAGNVMAKCGCTRWN